MKLKKYKLGELIDVTRGQSLSGEYYATEGKYIRLTCGNFDYNNNCFKENTSKDNLFFTGTIKPEFIMEKGDIITPLTEQAIGLLGSTAIIPESDKYIQSQDVAKIICKENKLDHDFAFYLISSKLIKKQLSVAAQQTKIRHTSPDKIKDCTVWIPDIENQRRIASVLSTLDRKISLNRTINAELERMAKEIYDYWFVQFEFPRSVSGESGLPELSRTDDGNGQSQFPDANGRPYKSSGGAMVYNPVLKREVPEGWEVKDLSKICKTKLGGTPDTSREEFWNGEFQWLNSGEVAEFPIVESEKSITQEGIDGSATSFLKAGSITLSITRHLRPSILAIDACINQSVVGIEENDIFKKSFIYPYLSREIPRLMTLRVGAQQPHINKETIDVSSIVIPPNEILKKYYETVDDIYEAIINNALQNKKLTSLRDELLPLLMTGQVEV